MADIPTYEQRFLPEAKGPSSFSLAGEKRSPIQIPRSKERMWASIVDSAEKITNIGAKIAVARDDSELQKLKVQLLEADKTLKGNMNSQEFRADNHYDNYVPYHEKEYQTIKKRLLKDFKGSSKAREKAGLIIDEMEINSRSWALSTSQQIETSDMQSGLLERIDKRGQLAIASANEGDLSVMNRAIADTEEDLAAMVARGVVTPVQAKALQREFNDTTQYAINVQRVDRAAALSENPDDPLAQEKSIEALKALIAEYDTPDTDKFRDKLRIQIKHYAEGKLRQLESDKETKDYTAKYLLERDWKNSIAKANETGDRILGIEERIYDVYRDEPEKADMYAMKYNDEITVAENFGKFVSAVPKASAESIPVLREEMEKMKTDENYDAWQSAQANFDRAVAQRQTALNSDPAGYVASTFETEDPSQMLAIQERLGVPEHARSIIPKDTADDMVKNMANMSGQEIVDQLDGMRRDLGDNWAIGYRDLVNAKMPTALRIVASLAEPGQREIRVKIAEVYKTDVKDLMNSVAGIKNMTAQDIKLAVDNELQEYMGPIRKSLINTFGFTSEGINQIADLKEVLEKTSYAYMLENHNATKATKLVVSEVIEGSYYYGEDDNYLIPKSVGLSPSKVESNTDDFLQKMEVDDLRGTDDNGKDIYRSTTEKKQALSNIKNGGYWANTPDQSGVMLLSPSGKMVHGKDGKPIVMTWADMVKPEPKPEPNNPIEPGTSPKLAEPLPDFRVNKRSH